METSYHRPVLLQEAVSFLQPAPGRVYIDATLGGGGHALALLQQGARVIGVDRDPEALKAAEKKLSPFRGRFLLIHKNFRYLEDCLAEAGLNKVDGILMDLGVSSHQLDTVERGFSYSVDAPLDMRMNPSRGQTAADLVNSLPVKELARIIRLYGEERWASRIAREIGRRRETDRITTTGELVEAVIKAIPAPARRKGPHPAKRTFQALRIAVNDELNALSQSIKTATHHLLPGGRIAIISYHSLEDRIVKHEFRQGENPCTCSPQQPYCTCGKVPTLKVLTRRPVYPGENEVAENPRARSARMRVAEAIGSNRREVE